MPKKKEKKMSFKEWLNKVADRYIEKHEPIKRFSVVPKESPTNPLAHEFYDYGEHGPKYYQPPFRPESPWYPSNNDAFLQEDELGRLGLDRKPGRFDLERDMRMDLFRGPKSYGALGTDLNIRDERNPGNRIYEFLKRIGKI